MTLGCLTLKVSMVFVKSEQHAYLFRLSMRPNEVLGKSSKSINYGCSVSGRFSFLWLGRWVSFISTRDLT